MPADVAFGIGVEAGDVLDAPVHGEGRARQGRLEVVRGFGKAGEAGKVEVLAGANLPSLIKLIGVRTSMPLDQAVKEAIAAGKKYMRSGSAELATAPARPSA